jgi:hypothetical protein
MQIKEVRHMTRRPLHTSALSQRLRGCGAIANYLSGNITVEEFARVMKESGQNPSDEEVQQIIKEVDLDGDGTINFDGNTPPSLTQPPPCFL